LQRLIHEPESSLPEDWQWPLAEVAITSDLPHEEAFWLLSRAGVLPGKVARLCALEIAREGAELVGCNVMDIYERYSVLIRSGAKTGCYDGGARALLTAGPPVVNAYVQSAFEAVASREPHFAVRRAGAHAVRACVEMGVLRAQFMCDFRAATRRSVFREMV